LEGDHWVVYHCERLDPIATESEVQITPRSFNEETILAILDEMAANA
jgi:hypothetical protein